MTFAGHWIAALLAAATGSSAAPAVVSSESPPARHAARHMVYVEAFGKGGVYGLGYGYAIDRAITVGGVVSLLPLDGQRYTTLAPSLTFYPVGGEHHRMFVDAGPLLVQVRTPPGDEASAYDQYGLGAQASTGYEYRHRALVRVFAMLEVGSNGLAPWFGADLGWTL